MDRFDQILVLDQGRLLEQGTHMQLLDRRGLYANLYEQSRLADSAIKTSSPVYPCHPLLKQR